jgi:hypothetical protein
MYGPLVSAAIDAAAASCILGRDIPDAVTVTAEVSRQLLSLLPCASDGLPLRAALAVALEAAADD